MKKIWQLVLYLAITSLPAIAQTKNVVLFIGDGAGVSSLNAASMYGFQRPEALYVQSMPNLALADTSTAREWVTDAAAAATAWATGVKGRNGVVSQSSSAEPGIKDGETLNTDIFHYMMRAFGWESSIAQVKQ